MDPSVSGSVIAALGEDLFLLSIRRRDGKLLTRERIDSALMASELIRLAAAKAALAGLASTIGLSDVLYPGREGRAQRARMAQIARQQVITQATAGRGTESGRVPPAAPVTGPAPRDAAGELVRGSAAEGGPGPASLLAMEGVIAATVHALTAVIEDGSIVASEIVGTRVGGIHIPGAQDAAGHGGEGHHAGTHGDGGGFGHH